VQKGMVVMEVAVVFSLLVVLYIARTYIWNSGKSELPQGKQHLPPANTRRYEFDTATDLLKEISTKWQKPYHTLPVHVDIPRLAKKIIIYGDGEIVHKPQEDNACNTSSGNLFADLPRQDNTIKDIIVTLSKWLGDSQEQQESISTKYASFFGSGDPSLSLNEFIEHVVGVDSNVVKVLKACNQSILAPGVLKLKVAVGNQFPFKDMRGSWRIEIQIDSERVSVTHLKVERSFEDESTEYFEFAWTLRIVFDRQLTRVLEVQLYIDDVLYGDKMDTSKRRKIREVMGAFARTKL